MNGLRILRVFVLTQAQVVPHLLLLGPQVRKGVRGRRDLAGDQRDRDTRGGQRAGLVRVVREEANSPYAKLVQDRGGQAEVPTIRPEAQGVVGIDRVEAGVLKLVGPQFRHQADAAALLVLVDHQPAAFRGDGPHGDLQLVVAVAAQRPEHLAGEALRMDAHEGRALGQIAEDQCERGIRLSRAVHNHALKRHGLKHSPLGGHPGGSNSPDRQGLCHGCHGASSCVLSLMRRTPRESSQCPSAFVESGKTYVAVAGSLDFVKSGFRFSRNAVSASLASGERSRTA